MNPPKVLCVIPARGGSKGIPRKNIRLLAGQSLIERAFNSISQLDFIDRVMLSTEDLEIAQHGLDLGIEVPFLRPMELALDESTMVSVVNHLLNALDCLEKYSPDIILILQPTSPLRTARHIQEAYTLFIGKQCSSLVSVTQIPHNYNPEGIMYMSPYGNLTYYDNSSKPIHTRQSKPTYFARNGAAIYLVKPDLIKREETFFGKDLVGYKMDKISSIDIDDWEDWLLVTAILKNQSDLLEGVL